MDFGLFLLAGKLQMDDKIFNDLCAHAEKLRVDLVSVRLTYAELEERIAKQHAIIENRDRKLDDARSQQKTSEHYISHLKSVIQGLHQERATTLKLLSDFPGHVDENSWYSWIARKNAILHGEEHEAQDTGKGHPENDAGVAAAQGFQSVAAEQRGNERDVQRQESVRQI